VCNEINVALDIHKVSFIFLGVRCAERLFTLAAHLVEGEALDIHFQFVSDLEPLFEIPYILLPKNGG
jgi:hypothetical protein